MKLEEVESGKASNMSHVAKRGNVIFNDLYSCDWLGLGCRKNAMPNISNGQFVNPNRHRLDRDIPVNVLSLTAGLVPR